MQVSNTRTGTDDAREGIINSLIEWSKGSQDPEAIQGEVTEFMLST